MLDVIELGELATGVRGDEVGELPGGLPAEVGAIDEEEDALGTGVLDQTVGEGAGGEGLSRAGGHLDEGAGMILGKGLLELRDRLELAGAEALAGERMGDGHPGKPRPQGLRLDDPSGQRLGTMEAEDPAGAGMRVTLVPEEGLRAGRFVKEWEALDSRGEELGEEVGKLSGIVSRLLRHGGKGRADFLGLDHSDGLTVHQQEVIAAAGLQRNLADGNALSGAEVDGAVVLYHPATGNQHRVDLLTGEGFGGEVGHKNGVRQITLRIVGGEEGMSLSDRST